MALDKNRILQLERLQKQLCIDFGELELLNQAFIHPSYANEGGEIKDNQRLEFLGDSVLELSVSHYLYIHHSELSEGQMTKVRALSVCETSLAQISRHLSLGDYLILGKGEEITGGREKPSILADTFEALVGAIYIDKGFDIARDFIIDNLFNIIDAAVKGNIIEDYKTALQEWLQKFSQDAILYRVVGETGPDHQKEFQVQVLWKEQILGEGKGLSKKQAEQQAAKSALEKIRLKHQK